ncbi:hypothetical protein DH86_00002082, partial [Scytalidium sp. 3C]
NGDGSGFWGRVAPDVNWTIMGTGPGAGTYTSLAELSANTIGKLVQFVDGPMKFKVRNILFAGGTVEWTTAELQSNGRTKNGKDFVHNFVLILRWNDQSQVVEVRDYLDSALLKQIFEENEGL